MTMIVMEPILIFATGMLGYSALEMLWRGRTHWTMLLLGGICFLALYYITAYFSLVPPLLWLLCAAVITTLEFLCGCLVNLRLGWQVWDYSGQPGNLLGQICPLFMLIWYLLSIPCCALASAMRTWLCAAAGV